VLGLEQVVHGAGRQRGEGRVGGREHGERACALERVDQAGCGEGGGEGLELACRHGGVDDVAPCLRRRGLGTRRLPGERERRGEAQGQRGDQGADGGGGAEGGGGGTGHRGASGSGEVASFRD